MRTDDPVLKTVLSSNYQLRVPIFQRRYVWGQHEHEQLWNATQRQLAGQRSDPPHFMGALVLASARQRPAESRPIRVIIDGQQRLITLQLLLSVLRSYASGTTRKEISPLLHWYVPENRRRTPENFLRVYPGEEDRVDFFKLIAADDPGSVELEQPRGPIAMAWDFFDQAVYTHVRRRPREAAVKRVKRVVLDRLRFVEIVTENDANPQEVFETLNAEGVKLDQSDLVRNFAFMSAASKADELYESAWHPFERQLTERQLETFLHTWTLTTDAALTWRGSRIPRGDYYPVAKAALSGSNPSAVEGKVRKLAQRGELFVDLTKARSDGSGRIGRSISSLLEEQQDFTAATMPVLHYLYARYRARTRANTKLSGAEFLKCVHLLESFVVRWMLAGRNQSPLISMFRTMVASPDFAREAASVSGAVRRYLRTKGGPSDADIEANLKGRSFYTGPGTNRQKFLLLRRLVYAHQYRTRHGKFLLNAYDPDAQLVPITTPRWTIDHIFPQQDAKWRADLRRWRVDLEGMRQLRDFIGNLCVTPRNQRMQNAKWQEKRAWYEGDDMLRMHRKIANNRVWRPQHITRRSRELARLAIRLWPAP